jgi:hypothetical protein
VAVVDKPLQGAFVAYFCLALMEITHNQIVTYHEVKIPKPLFSYGTFVVRAGPRLGHHKQAHNFAPFQTNLLQIFVQHLLVGAGSN